MTLAVASVNGQGYLAHYVLLGLSMVCAVLVVAKVLPRGEELPTNGRAKTRIVAGLLPPHVTEYGEGREVDIIRLALPEAEIELFVQPFSRHWNSFETTSRFDAVATVPSHILLKKGYRSKEHYIEYQNGLGYARETFPKGIERAGSGGFDFTPLVGRDVGAFAGASAIIPGLSAHIPLFSLYVERTNQSVLSALLRQGKVDAVLEDEGIFREYNKRLDPAWASSLCFSAVFEPTPYQMVFSTMENRDRFDARIQLLRQSGELARIDANYDLHSARIDKSCP